MIKTTSEAFIQQFQQEDSVGSLEKLDRAGVFMFHLSSLVDQSLETSSMLGSV